MHLLEVKNIEKSFGGAKILHNINFSVSSGEFMVLVGPSGCGKSTLLRMIAGLEKIDDGEIYIDGKKVNQLEPKDRNIAMVFQSYALYPHMSVFENMAFGLKVRKQHSDEEIKKRVYEAAELLQLTKYLQRKPKDLSGGQRQRVALGRAIVRKPKVFLFDEPLSNLDAQLRTQMRLELKKIHSLLGNAMLYVTHDQIEATTMGDKIAVLSQGKLQQLDSPRELYWNPQNQFVASFIGIPEMNFIDGYANEGLFQFSQETVKIKYNGKGQIRLGIRPEFFSLLQKKDENYSFTSKIDFIENLGSQLLLHIKWKNIPIRMLAPVGAPLKAGMDILVGFELDKVLYFDSVTGEKL